MEGNNNNKAQDFRFLNELIAASTGLKPSGDSSVEA